MANEMLEGAAAARDCAKSHDPDTATACKEFVTKFCDRAQSAFELSQDETDWWRANSPTFQNQPAAAKSMYQPPKLIPQTRLVACGMDKIQVVQGYDVGGNKSNRGVGAAKKPKAKDAAPVAPGSTGAIAAAAPAPKEVKGVIATAPPVKKCREREVGGIVTRAEARGCLSEQSCAASRSCKAVTAPVQVPDAGTEASRNARPEGPGSRRFPATISSQTNRRPNRRTTIDAEECSDKQRCDGNFWRTTIRPLGRTRFSAGLIFDAGGSGKS